MEPETLNSFLRKAERRVILGEKDIARQVRQISKLQRSGQDSRLARAWLVELEDQLGRNLAQRDRLKRSLACYYDGGNVAA